ncbi:MAG: hypothetical protein FWC55_01265 [Firmicutes bacterium]|nr:hypothetical protein [Bacillota bacterium]
MSKKSIAVLLAMTMVIGVLAGCRGNNAPSPSPAVTAGAEATPSPEAAKATATPAPAASTEPSAEQPKAPSVTDLIAMFDKVSDTSELPDWTGAPLKITSWYAHGIGDPNHLESSNDVFWPEIKRIFGIEIDKANSFDNQGISKTEKMATLAATNAWPSIGMSILENDDILNEGLLYDLTELLPKYAPHYWELINRVAPITTARGLRNSGKLWGVGWVDNTDETMQILYPDKFNAEKYMYVRDPNEWSFPMYVRDDILKLIYPNAKSQQEIEDLYMAQGYFTKEQVYDIPLKNKQDVKDFLYKVRDAIAANNIQEGGRPVNTINMTYGSGGDLWSLVPCFYAPIQGLMSNNWNYFMNFNNKTKKFERAIDTELWKNMMRELNQWVRDGVGAKESVGIDTPEIFDSKMRNGEYAVLYTWTYPSNADLKAAGKPYQYRKVYVDCPFDNSTYVDYAPVLDFTAAATAIFKTVPEDQVPQILAWWDLMFTDAGQKLQVWGPRSAGLFTEDANGKRKYTDPELEACMVGGTANDADVKYNLASGLMGVINERWFAPAFPQIHVGIRAGGLNNPKYVDYDMSTMPRSPDNAGKFFSSLLFQPRTRYSPAPTIDTYPASYTSEIPELQRWWDAREAWDSGASVKVLTAKDDAEFEKLWAEYVAAYDDNGFTADVCGKVEELLKTKYPDDWNAYMNAKPMEQ